MKRHLISFILFILPVTTVAVPENILFRSCGIYEVTGIYSCKTSPNCTITVYPKTLSETQIELTSPPKHAEHLIDSFIHTKIQITKSQPKHVIASSLEEVPLRSRSDSTQNAIHLVKAELCAKK